MHDYQYVYLGLGTNMGDKYNNLVESIKQLGIHPHIWVTNSSFIYESEPMYNLNQDKFYNMVIEIETNLLPIELLDYIKQIELNLGRKNTNIKNLPRIIDIDILVFKNLKINSEILTVPHPLIAERKFVIKPWNDIAPNLIIPELDVKVCDLLNNTVDKSDPRMILIDNEKGTI